jgi:hypothetical protein
MEEEVAMFPNHAQAKKLEHVTRLKIVEVVLYDLFLAAI